MARPGLATSLRAQGKAPTIQAVLMPPDEIDKELALWLQEEEVAVEEAWLGRDTATLEVVMEAVSPLKWGQLKGLGTVTVQVIAPSQVAGPSQLST